MIKKTLHAGNRFPDINVPQLGGGQLSLGQPQGANDWQMVVVYRGKHCPMCTTYLTELSHLVPSFNDLGVDVIAVSADPRQKAEEQIALVNPSFSVGYDLSIAQMLQLGLYISDPRSPEETDKPFAEPGVFVVNAERHLQLISLSNAPFARPDLRTLQGGVAFIRNPANSYPIRGMHQAA